MISVATVLLALSSSALGSSFTITSASSAPQQQQHLSKAAFEEGLGNTASPLGMSTSNAADTAAPATVTGSEARAATTTDSSTAAEQQLRSQSPTHLLVLCHGLSGCPGDLGYLEEAIVREGGSSIVVLNSSSNQSKTRDGVEAGGKRVAEEVKAVIAATPSLQVYTCIH
jgi:Putative serine esterase (DUF676)